MSYFEKSLTAALKTVKTTLDPEKLDSLKELAKDCDGAFRNYKKNLMGPQSKIQAANAIMMSRRDSFRFIIDQDPELEKAFAKAYAQTQL